VIAILLPAEEWEALATKDVVAVPGAEGFVHCCDERQIDAVRGAYLANVDHVVAVLVDPTLLAAETRYESGAGGETERFPHVYGLITRTAVVGVRQVS
jgi:uncharacterized protein (DUF952 family)